jgi:hypothetical protein
MQVTSVENLVTLYSRYLETRTKDDLLAAAMAYNNASTDVQQVFAAWWRQS